MAFLSDLGKKVSLTAQEVAKQAKESVEISRQEISIADENRKINGIFQQIGKLYYELHADNCEEAFSDFVSQIKDCENRIAQYKEQIDRVKGVKKCPQCGGDSPLEAKFCNSCGYHFVNNSTEAAPVDKTIKCAKCGSELSEGSAFCENCGASIASQQNESGESNTEVVKVIKCANCGEDVGDSAFCTNCGTKVERTEA